jgi:hypothetical protein
MEAKMATRNSGGFTDRVAEEALRRLGGVVQREIAEGLAGLFRVQGAGVAADTERGGFAGAGLQVVIYNNAGVSVTARETSGAFDRKQLEITIDQMVAGALVRGRQTTGILNGLFNLSPALSGR